MQDHPATLVVKQASETEILGLLVLVFSLTSPAVATLSSWAGEGLQQAVADGHSVLCSLWADPVNSTKIPEP